MLNYFFKQEYICKAYWNNEIISVTTGSAFSAAITKLILKILPQHQDLSFTLDRI